MKLDYEVIEDSFDDTTHMRTMTEQAPAPNGGLLLRTTVYTPHHLSIDVTLIPDAKAEGERFTPIA